MKKGGKGGYTSRNVHACLAKATFVVPYFDFGLHLRHQGKLHFLFHYLRFSTWKTRADAEYPGRMSKHVNVVFFLGLLETCAYTSKDPRCALCSRPFFKDDAPGLPRLVVPVRFRVFPALFGQKTPKRTGMTRLAPQACHPSSFRGFSGPFRPQKNTKRNGMTPNPFLGFPGNFRPETPKQLCYFLQENTKDCKVGPTMHSSNNEIKSLCVCAIVLLCLAPDKTRIGRPQHAVGSSSSCI